MGFIKIEMTSVKKNRVGIPRRRSLSIGKKSSCFFSSKSGMNRLEGKKKRLMKNERLKVKKTQYGCPERCIEVPPLHRTEELFRMVKYHDDKQGYLRVIDVFQQLL